MTTDHAREMLEEEKLKLEGEMGNIGMKNPLVPGDWEALPADAETEADLVDQADVVVNRDNSVAIFADLQARYGMVLSALAKLSAGTYGTCETCGAPIEDARLAIDPAAPTCIAHR